MDLFKIRKELNFGKTLKDLNLKVTYYSRVSTTNKEQHTSLENQITYFDEMIKENNNWIYIKGYIDNGITGTSDTKRENFMKMINDARKGLFDLIITKEISRFSRNTLDSIKYTRELLSYGVAVLFVNDNINTALPDSELRLTIMASMAQDEIRRLSERVKFGMHESIKKGHILGNDMLYGYKKNKNTNNLEIVKDEAKVVKRLFSLYTKEKISITKISHIFNNEKIKTRQGNKWCTSTLTRMIKNIKYKGYYCGKKSEVIDYMSKKIKKNPKQDWILYKDYQKIPPIIDENTWNIANKKIKKKTKSNYHHKYLLTNKIYCLKDNYPYYRRVTNNNNIVWICSNYLKNQKKSCLTAILPEIEIYSILKNIFRKYKLDQKRLINILLSPYKEEPSIDKITILKKKKTKLLDLYLENNISKEEYLNLVDKYNKVLKNNYNQSSNNNFIHDYIEKNIFKYYLKLLLLKIKSLKIDNNHTILLIYLKKIDNLTKLKIKTKFIYKNKEKEYHILAIFK